MIFSEQMLLNLWGLAQVATIIVFILFVVAVVVGILDKHMTQRERRKSIKRTEEMMKRIADSEETIAHKHMVTHAHEAGEVLRKGDLVIAREDGLMYKADKGDFIPHVKLAKNPEIKKEDTALSVSEETRKAKNRARMAKYRAKKRKNK